MKVWPEFFANNSSLALVVLQFEVNSSGEEDFLQRVGWTACVCFNAISYVLLSPDDCSNSPGRSYVEEERISDPI